MFKRILCSAALLACLAPVHAAEQQYSWSFSGFTDLDSGSWEIKDVVSGFFTVDDLNADGKYDRSEVSSIFYNGYEFTCCTNCQFTEFAWVPGSSPTFYITRSEYYDWGYSWERVWAGNNFGHGSTAYGGGEPFYTGGRWTDKTVAVITAVPEPQTWLMLGAGLLAVGGLARRRAKMLVRSDKL